MKSRALRFALLALFVGLVVAAALWWQKETENLAARNASHAFDERAGVVTRSFLEIKSAQPGYVAAGQGEDYWVSRVDTLIAGAREGSRRSSRSPACRGRKQRSTALADLEDFEQMDRRARDYVRGGQRLLASDLVFSDGIEKMDGAVSAIERARLGESSAMQETIGTRRREQLLTAGGAAALAVMIVFMLVPLPRSRPPRARLPKRRRRRRERGAAFDCSTAGIGETDAALDGSRARTGSQRRTCSYLFSAKTFRSRGRSGRDRRTVQRSHACDRPACAARRARTGGVAAQCVGTGDLGRRSGWP